MKANELMIGDWIQIADEGYNSMRGQYHQIDWIRTGELGLDNRKIITPPYAEPIPLTPEILEKNGWKPAKFDGGYGRKGMRLDGPDYEDGLPEGIENALSFAQWSIDEHFEYHLLDIYMWKGSLHLWVNYVHELQHALRICGIEKEIVL